MASLDARHLGDLGLHHLGHHLKTDRRRGRQQPLTDVLGERDQMPVDRTGKPLRQPSICGRDQSQPGRLTDGVISGQGRVRT
jgi:hypothetical protein